MSRYYLSQYVQRNVEGLGVGFTSPREGRANCLDLRPDQTVVGWHLLWVDSPLTPTEIVDGSAYDLGDDPVGVLPASVRNGLNSRLGITLDEDALGKIAAELFITRSDRTVGFIPKLDPDTGKRTKYRGIYLGPAGFRIWEQFYRGGPGASLSETWTTADSDDPSGDHTWAEMDSSDFDVVSNRLRAVGTGWVKLQADLDSGDCEAAVDVYNTGIGSTAWWGTAVRFGGAGVAVGDIDCYSEQIRNDGNAASGLYEYTNNSFSAIDTGAVTGLSDGDEVKTLANGTDIEGYVRGVLEHSGTNSVWDNTRTRTGLYTAAVGGQEFDDFLAQDLSVDKKPYKLRSSFTSFRPRGRRRARFA